VVPATRAIAPSRRWRTRQHAAPAALAIGAVLIGIYLLLPTPDIQEFAYQVPGMLAVVAVLAGIAIHRPQARGPWILLALGLALTTAGDWTWVILERAFGVEPFPSVADAFYLSGIGVTGAALVWLVRGRIPDGDRAGVLDALIVAVGAGLVSWIFLMAPIVADASATTAETAFAVAYPLVDIVILAVLVRIALAPGRKVPALAMLLGALLALLAADFAYAGLALADGYRTGHPVETGWLASSVLYAGAALHPSMLELTAPVEAGEVRLGAWRVVLLAIASLMAPAVLLVQWVARAPIDVPIIAGASIVLFLLVIARLSGVVADLGSNLQRRQALEAELQQRAFHDPLTGLANRTLFADRLGRALAQRDEPVAVLFLDLDDFKTINDSHGHLAGDELLIAVARSLAANVPPGDTVARLGGDEFAVLVDRGATEGVARQLADRLIAGLRRPVPVAGRDRTVGASIGISLGRSGQSSAEQLMSEADIAMYVAKGEGKGGSSVFDPRTHAAVVRSIGLRDDLDRAIREREFEMHYQPIIELESGDLAGVEALARWRHPTRGLLAPADFIAVAESTGTIIGMGQWILDESCRQAAAWSAGPLADRRFMSINLSTIQITYPGFVEFVTDAVARARVDPSILLLEVTESANPDPDSVVEALLRLHALGIRLAVDDFGSGFASMEQLARLPFAVIKMDRSLVAAVDTDPRAESVVTGVTDIARRLGAQTVAEGVERPEQIPPLRAMGCQMAQGFHFAPALPADQLEALVASSAAPGTAVMRSAPRPATS